MHPQFLKGIRFVDLTWAGAGPFSTKLFSDFGADVIKVESASRPDPVRVGGPYRTRFPASTAAAISPRATPARTASPSTSRTRRAARSCSS